MQNLVNLVLNNASYQNYERRTPSSTGYTEDAFPNSAASSGYYEELSYAYFDHYDFNLDGTPDATYFPDPDGEFQNLSFGRIKDQPTGTKVKVLNRPDISAPAAWIESANFYDQYGRVIHTKANNHNNGTELSYTEYDFPGKMLQTKTIHAYNSPDEIKIRNRYTYDHAGRVKQVFQRNNADPEIILSQSNYNAIGELIEKNIHSADNGQSWLQSIDYGYHIRGWLKNINDCELKNNFAAMNREYFLEKLKIKVKEKKDQFGNQALYLQIILHKSDDPNSSPTEKLLHESRLMDSAPGNPAYDELVAVKGQNIPMNFQNESLSPANIDQTEVLVVDKVTDALTANGITNTTAVTQTVASTCAFLQAQALSDYVNNDNDDLWGMELAYETGNASLNGDQRWNGLLTAMCGKSKTDNVKRGYGFRYDVLSRLTSAKYKAVNNGGFKWNFETGHYDVPRIDYDQNGNITRLNRMGYVEVNGNPSFGAMDKLRYKYRGNQLRSVKDNATVSGYNDFRDNGAISNFDYTYDGNGNLTSDANKGYTASWNHLNLPEKVDFGTGREILWLYDAAGTKLRKLVKAPGQADETRDYINGVVYQDGTMEFFFSEEGRIVLDNSNGNTFRYEHFYKDHLGNTRLGYSDLDGDGAIDPQSEVIQEEHYYPFGMSFAGITKPQIGVEFGFKFNGVELQEDFGLNLYSTDFRMLDVQLGRWIGIDPKADERESPYVGFANNPVIFIDPQGDTIRAVSAAKAEIMRSIIAGSFQS
ncbi:MAG: RHS repeat-associated core domain-containing protein, partial [Bacteroidota bacterium]